MQSYIGVCFSRLSERVIRAKSWGCSLLRCFESRTSQKMASPVVCKDHNINQFVRELHRSSKLNSGRKKKMTVKDRGWWSVMSSGNTCIPFYIISEFICLWIHIKPPKVLRLLVFWSLRALPYIYTYLFRRLLCIEDSIIPIFMYTSRMADTVFLSHPKHIYVSAIEAPPKWKTTNMTLLQSIVTAIAMSFNASVQHLMTSV